MNLKKLLGFAALALVLFFVISQPASSAGLVTNILHMLRDGANALITFVRNVVG